MLSSHQGCTTQPLCEKTSHTYAVIHHEHQQALSSLAYVFAAYLQHYSPGFASKHGLGENSKQAFLYACFLKRQPSQAAAEWFFLPCSNRAQGM